MGKFRGFGVAMPTPFTESGDVAWEAIDELVEILITGGIDFIVPCGTTGESPTLSHQEHIDVIIRVVNAVNERIPVLAGTGSNSFSETLEMTQAAQDCGVDGAMAVVPYYNKPTVSGITMHYEKLANAVDLPIVLYDIPGRTGIKVSAETIIRLANSRIINGLKWASGDLHQLEDVLSGCPDDFDVLSGNDDQTLDCMIRGGHGVISVIGNIIPNDFCTFIRLMENEFWTNARNTHMRLRPLMRAMFLETNPIPVKTALSLLRPEKFLPSFRLPMCGMEIENRTKLLKCLQNYGSI